MGVTRITSAMLPLRSALHLPWSSKILLPAMVLTLLLGISVPILLASPIWIDVMFYDLCARTVMNGGTHYRDIFDTNLFGMVWTHIAIRSLFGWSSEVIRLVDLLVVAGVICFLTLWLRPLKLSRGNRIWLSVVLFACYSAMSEWSHCQRDVWMLLPALAAVWLRRRHVCAAIAPPPTFCRLALACGEGVCWALAIGIKPMTVVPALCCWLISVHLVSRSSRVWFGLVAVDLLGLIVGASTVAGVAAYWLLQSGASPYLWEIMLQWNPEYVAYSLQWGVRTTHWKLWAEANLPWSLVHIVAVPASIYVIVQWIVRRRGSIESLMAETSWLLLVGLYLGWAIQVFLLQAPHEYVQVPLLLLAVAVCAAVVNAQIHTYRVARWVCVAFLVFAVIRHPMRDGTE